MIMIWLSEEEERLLSEMLGEISKEELLGNWQAFMEFTPIPSGSPQEREAIEFIKRRLEEYGLEPRLHWFDAYITEPKYARLEVLSPRRMEVQCTPYRQVGSTGPEGFEGEVIYVSPEEIGEVECRDKIILAEQRVAGEWMGLRDGLLLRLQRMGVKGLIVIEQDTYVPTVCHQRADFSVSGNPTPDNIDEIQRIPAIVHVSNRDGQLLKMMAKEGGMRVHIVSIVETSWRKLPLLTAEIKGAKDPEHFLLVHGHVDTPPFSPGVTDNASGVTAMLELARILNKYREHLRRSIRFAFWTGHEIGRYAGSTWYNDAFWFDLRYRCVGCLNIDSPGAEGATTYRAVGIGELEELSKESIKAATGIEVEGRRWPTRAGDSSFWGTGLPQTIVVSARPKDLYDPFVNYSGGGWWWHTPYATMEHGDIDILVMDVRVELNFIYRMANCPILPLNFVPYADEMVRILKEMQQKAEKVRPYFDLDPVMERAEEFRELAWRLEKAAKKLVEKGLPEREVELLNHCLMWISRHINPVAHSNAEKTEQMSMEYFGRIPFQRLHEITKLAEMTLPYSHEFHLLRTKLLRQRNYVEDGFYQANMLIKETLKKLSLL
jgi:hypothetical protein